MELVKKCEYDRDGICIIASRLVNAPVQIPKNACKVCLSSKRPKQINNITISIAGRSVPFLRERLMQQYFGESLNPGVGTELHWLLHEKGFKVEKNCECIPLIHNMNAKGVVWTLNNLELISEAMRKEYRKRFPNSIIPDWLLGFAAHKLIKQAVNAFQDD